MRVRSTRDVKGSPQEAGTTLRPNPQPPLGILSGGIGMHSGHSTHRRPVTPRRNTNLPNKRTREMALVGKPGQQRNLRDRPALRKMASRRLHAQLHAVGVGCRTHVAHKASNQLKAADVASQGKRR